jgi:GxxExxY protein
MLRSIAGWLATTESRRNEMRNSNHENTKERKHEKLERRRDGDIICVSNSEGIDLMHEIVSNQKHEFETLNKNIFGCAINVHKTLGPGFLENIYEQALVIELNENRLRFESQKEIEIAYRGVKVGTHRLDLPVEDTIIVELKATKDLVDFYLAQLRSYLKAANLKVGLLINFSKPTLEVKRVVN